MIQLDEQVKAIHISNILGKVVIKTHSEKNVLIQTTEEEKVDVSCRGKKLLIQTKLSEQNTTQKKGVFRNIFGGVTITNTGNNVIVQNGNVIVNGMASADLATVDMTIFVPFGSVHTVDASGTIELDVESVADQVTLDYSGQTISKVRGIARVNLDFSGQSNATIIGAKQVDADLSGQSQIRIDSEDMSKFLLDASGMSHVVVKSTSIEEVDLDISGMCQVVISGKVGKKMIDKSAMAKIQFLG